MGTLLSGRFLLIIHAVRRMPKGLSCMPACQMLTRSAFHVSTGPTLHACIGTAATYPPPLVRAFWITVIGCRSTIRVFDLRYSLGGGGLFFHLPARFGGSLNAQCFTSP